MGQIAPRFLVLFFQLVLLFFSNRPEKRRAQGVEVVVLRPPRSGVAVGNVAQLRQVRFLPSEQDWTSDWDQTQVIWHDGALKDFSFRSTW